MAKPKKAKAGTKAPETAKSAKEIERAPEPEAPPLQPQVTHAEPLQETIPPPEALVLNAVEQLLQPSSPAPNHDTVSARSQEERRNLDQDNGSEVGLLDMPRKRSNAVAAQQAGSAPAANDAWGRGAAEADGMWGSAQHANSPAMGSTYGGAAGGTWGEPDNWGTSGGRAATSWDTPAVPAQPAPSAAASGKKLKKDKKGGASKVSFAPVEAASAPPAPPPPPPQPAHATSGAWGSPATTVGGYGGYGGYGDYDEEEEEEEWDEQAPSNYWNAPDSAQVPAATPAAAKPAQSSWQKWATEAKTLPQSYTAQAPNPPGQNQAAQAAAMQQQHEQRLRAQLMQAQMQQQAQMQAQQNAQAHQAQLQAQQQAQRAHLAQQAAFFQQGQGRGGQPNAQQHQHQHQQHAHMQNQAYRAPPMQQADSWGSNTGWADGGWQKNQWTEAIPEEDEDEEEEEDEDDAVDDGWGNPRQHDQFSPHVSYQYGAPPGGGFAPAPPSQAGPSPSQHPRAHVAPSPSQNPHQQIWTAPSPSAASKTMSMATGRKTTVFEHAPPRSGMGEMTTLESYGAALTPAQRALYGGPPPARLARDRIHWMFNPEKDPRVSGLLRWVTAFQNGLATLGVEKFLQSGQRGALIANADYRTSTAGANSQPGLDWITLDDLARTRDRIFQESVVFYDPAFQVIVFVFLLSTTGNSMAVWRRRLHVPESLRLAHQQELLAAKAQLKKDVPVYVDELPSKDDAAGGPKKKRGFFSKRKWLNFKW